MIKQLINNIKEQAEHIGGIGSFKYEGEDLINAQHNNAVIQMIVEDNIYVEYLTTKDVVRVSVNIDIFDKITDTNDKVTIHNNTFKIGVVLLKLLQSNYGNVMSINDYDFLFVSRYSDDELCGVRMSVELIMPTPITYCNIVEFIDKSNKYASVEDFEITINQPKIDVSKLDINPIKLKKNE